MGERVQLGRYGENYHQRVWLEVGPITGALSTATARQVHGPAMGFNNHRDGQAALELAYETPQPCVVIVKHQVPCGYATAERQLHAFERAWQGDPQAAFGSVIAFNRPLTLETAQAFSERQNPDGKRGWFIEVVAAPGYDDGVVGYIQGKPGKKGLRLLDTGPFKDLHLPDIEAYAIPDGELTQERDAELFLVPLAGLFSGEPRDVPEPNAGKVLRAGVVSNRRPEGAQVGLYEFAFRAVKYLKSNAISIARELAPGSYQLIGHGTGQTMRSRAARHAAELALQNLALEYRIAMADRIRVEPHETAMLESQHEGIKDGVLQGKFEPSASNDYKPFEYNYATNVLRGAVAGSDAFMPFPDSVEILGDAGVGGIIQPGGGNKDDACIATANKHDMVMVFTGRRHFRH